MAQPALTDSFVASWLGFLSISSIMQQHHQQRFEAGLGLCLQPLRKEGTLCSRSPEGQGVEVPELLLPRCRGGPW